MEWPSGDKADCPSSTVKSHSDLRSSVEQPPAEAVKEETIDDDEDWVDPQDLCQTSFFEIPIASPEPDEPPRQIVTLESRVKILARDRHFVEINGAMVELGSLEIPATSGFNKDVQYKLGVGSDSKLVLLPQHETNDANVSSTSNQIFTCSTCQDTFPALTQLLSHEYQFNLPERLPMYCTKCHVMNNSNNSCDCELPFQYPCAVKECTVKFSSSKDLAHHLKRDCSVVRSSKTQLCSSAQRLMKHLQSYEASVTSALDMAERRRSSIPVPNLTSDSVVLKTEIKSEEGESEVTGITP